ncbi:MAG: outer membrane protein assembly factor BamE, partial [Bdellovibrionota bacterium]
ENAFWRTLMTPFTGTIWAKKFSEQNFAKIRPGMPRAEVEALLGSPLRKDCSEKGCMWVYSNQDTGTADYDRRWVVTDPTGRVTEVRHEFYID